MNDENNSTPNLRYFQILSYTKNRMYFHYLVFDFLFNPFPLIPSISLILLNFMKLLRIKRQEKTE
jgi:hypothetical protein